MTQTLTGRERALEVRRQVIKDLNQTLRDTFQGVEGVTVDELRSTSTRFYVGMNYLGRSDYVEIEAGKRTDDWYSSGRSVVRVRLFYGRGGTRTYQEKDGYFNTPKIISVITQYLTEQRQAAVHLDRRRKEEVIKNKRLRARVSIDFHQYCRKAYSTYAQDLYLRKYGYSIRISGFDEDTRMYDIHRYGKYSIEDAQELVRLLAKGGRKL